MKIISFLSLSLFCCNSAFSQLPCNMADHCLDIISATTIGPIITDTNCSIFDNITVEGCMESATPDTMILSCGANMLPTVWFEVKVDNKASLLSTLIKTDGSWHPIWAIYYGSCSNLTLIPASSAMDSVYCSNDDSNPSVHSVSVVNGVQSYFVAVSGDGVIDDPRFTLNAFTSSGCTSCIGDDGCNTTATWNVTKRSSARPLTDPFFNQGEEVTLCIQILYTSTGDADWLHGLVPDFGPGWDLTTFDPQAITISSGNPEWNDEGDGVCAPIIQEQMPYLCTYNDSVSGRLKLCNIACQTCPCSPPLLSGSPLPSGWFWNTNGGVGCQNDCRPSSHWGIGSTVSNISICMDLNVRKFNKETDCFDNRKLNINFHVLSDGVSGCWNDPDGKDCILDKAQIGPNWEIDFSKHDTCHVTITDTIYKTVTDTIHQTIIDTTYLTLIDTVYQTLTDTTFLTIVDTIYQTITDTSFIDIISYISVTDTLFITLNLPDASNQPTINDIKIYPNPASSHVNIDMGDHTLLNNYEVRILNSLGQSVYFTTIDQQLYDIDLSGWGGKGTYFVMIKNNLGETVANKKIVLR